MVIKFLIYHCVCPVKLLCGLEASQGAVEEVLSSAVSIRADSLDSSDDLDPEDDEENEIKSACKKKNKRRKGITCNLFLSILLNKWLWYRWLTLNCLFTVMCVWVVLTESSESRDGEDYPVDIWLLLSSYIRPEDVCRFALICRNAWTVTCTAAFWTRLYRRWVDLTIGQLHVVSGAYKVTKKVLVIGKSCQEWFVN